MERKAGRIISIACIAGSRASVTMPPYSVSNQGIITFSRIVAKGLAPHKVTVNAICREVLWTSGSTSHISSVEMTEPGRWTAS